MKKRGCLPINPGRNEGMYTLEGAITITVFTALFMMLLSLLSVIQVKAVIQKALNETALEVSQKAYVEEYTDELVFSYKDIFYERLNEFSEDMENWLIGRGIEDGVSGIRFDKSDVFSGDKYVDLIICYDLKVNTFGFLEKNLSVEQRAKTMAWLPLDYDMNSSDGLYNTSSIWSENQLVRGKYFVSTLKLQYPEKAVKSGIGIDLFDRDYRIATEIYSMNVFSESYTNFDEGKDELYLQLSDYAEKIKKDVEGSKGLIDMDDGSRVMLDSSAHMRLLIVVPEEAKDKTDIKSRLSETAARVESEHGISIEFAYMEKALND